MAVRGSTVYKNPTLYITEL